MVTMSSSQPFVILLCIVRPYWGIRHRLVCGCLVRPVFLVCGAQAKEQAAAQSAKDRDALKADLDVLLQQRGQMDSLKSMLMQKLHGGQTSAAGLASGVGPQRITYPTTVITGQGS